MVSIVIDKGIRKKMKEDWDKYYHVPVKENGENMNPCPAGCVRGTCTKGQVCKHDAECQYCQDTKTHQFYITGDRKSQIEPVYEEQYSALNRVILKNNEYIRKINRDIERSQNKKDNSEEEEEERQQLWSWVESKPFKSPLVIEEELDEDAEENEDPEENDDADDDAEEDDDETD